MIKKVSAFTLGTLISRITGLLRESVFAYLYGASGSTDAFQVAFRIPNLLRDLFSEAALSASFVPVFCEKIKKKETPEELFRFASNLFNLILIFVGGIVLLGILFSPVIVNLLGMGYRHIPGKIELTNNLTRIMLPFLLLVSLASLVMGILFSFGKFFIPAIAPASFNLVSILIPVATFALFRSSGKDPIYAMAYGVLFGALSQFLFQVPTLKREGFRYKIYLNLKDREAKMVFALWMPMVLGLAAYQINFAVNTFLITFLEEKSITYLNYAYRIMHLPAGLFGVAVGTVALQEFSLSTQEELKNKIDEALRLTAILTLPVSAILIGLSYPVVQLLYERGRFTPIDTLSTSRALFFYTFSVFPAASIRIFTSTFYSLKNTKTPALIASFIVVLNILLNLNLMRILRYLSFPLTTSLVSSLHVVILYLFLRKRIGSLVKSDFLPFLLKVALLSLILGYFSHRTFQFLRKFGLGVFLLVFLSAFLSLLLFYLLSRLLKIKELKELFKRLTEKEQKFYI
uniref:Probable lipid II flippase MurJ n=1 Tax=candidate division WOR-3 bacterium TaxID=2052148 RepID=A0A7C3UZ52_UNCW3